MTTTTTVSNRWPVNIKWDFAADGAPDEVKVAAVECGDVLVNQDGRTAVVDVVTARADGSGFILRTDPWGELHRSHSEYVCRVPRVAVEKSVDPQRAAAQADPRGERDR